MDTNILSSIATQNYTTYTNTDSQTLQTTNTTLQNYIGAISTTATSSVDTHSLALQDSLRGDSNTLYQEVSLLNNGIGVINTIDTTLNNQQDYLTQLKERVDEYNEALQDRKDKIAQEEEDRYKQKQDYELYLMLQSFNSEATNAIYRGLSLLSDDNALSLDGTENLYSTQTTADSTGYVTIYNSDDITQSGSSTLEFNIDDELYRLDTVEYGIDSYGVMDLSEQINDSQELDIYSEWEVSLYSDEPLEEGYIEELFINDVEIGAINLYATDEYQALEDAINAQSETTGVNAQIFQDEGSSYLMLQSDGRGIALSGDTDPLNLDSTETYGRLRLKRQNQQMLEFEDLDESIEEESTFTFNLADIFTELFRESSDGFSTEELLEFASDSIDSAQSHLQEYSDIINSDKKTFIDDVSNFIEVLNNQRASEYGVVYNPEDYEKFDPSRLSSEDIELSFTKNADSLKDIAINTLLDIDESMLPTDEIEKENRVVLNQDELNRQNPNFGIVNSDYFNQQEQDILTPTSYQNGNQDINKL
jgi:hypothetical protein